MTSRQRRNYAATFPVAHRGFVKKRGVREAFAQTSTRKIFPRSMSGKGGSRIPILPLKKVVNMQRAFVLAG